MAHSYQKTFWDLKSWFSNFWGRQKFLRPGASFWNFGVVGQKFSKISTLQNSQKPSFYNICCFLLFFGQSGLSCSHLPNFGELYTTRKSYWLYHFFFLWGDILSFFFLYSAVDEVKEKTITHIMHSKTHRFFFFLLFILGPKRTWDNNILRERQFQKTTWIRGFWCLTTVKASKMFCCF